MTTRLTIFQLGGSEGSTAGDCGFIKAESEQGKAHCVIDLGTSAEGQSSLIEKEFDQESEGVLLVTHLHADHTGRAQPPVHFTRKKWKAVHSKSLHHVRFGEGSKNQTDQWFTRWTNHRVPEENGEIIWTASLGEDTARLSVIMPDFDEVKQRVESKGKWDENEASLGALLEVRSREGALRFSFLTLGDMVPANSPAVLEVLKARDCDWIDVLKFPHHGSDNNYLECITTVLDMSRRAGRPTSVLISGFTSGEMKSWDKLIRDEARSVTLLVRNNSAATNLLSLSKLRTMRQRLETPFRVWRYARITFEKGAVQMAGKERTLQTFPHQVLSDASVETTETLCSSISKASTSGSSESRMMLKVGAQQKKLGKRKANREEESDQENEDSAHSEEEQPPAEPTSPQPKRRRKVVHHPPTTGQNPRMQEQ